MTDLSPQSRSIVDDGRSALAPTGDERRRMRAAIAARLAVTAVVAAPATAAAATAGGTSAAGGTVAASSSSLAGILKLTLVAGVVGAGGTATWIAVSDDEPAHIEAPAPAEPTAPRPSGVRRDRVASPPIAPPPAPVPQPESSPAPLHPKPAPETAPEPAPARLLAEEVRLLAPARQAVRHGDPSAALLALELYEEKHPDGQLAQEATLLRAEALCQLGRPAEATRILGRVRARNPDAPGLAAVEASCGRR
jgi:hypothetical protein